MITDVSTYVDPRSLMPQTTTSSSSRGLSLAEKMEQLKQQVNTFREHFSSLIRYVSNARKELGILKKQLRIREQIEEEAGAEAASQTDLIRIQRIHQSWQMIQIR